MSDLAIVYTPASVPGNLIGLDTSTGMQLLANSTSKNSHVIDSFVHQIDRSACGPVSLLILINAMKVVLRIKYSAVVDRYSSEEADRYLRGLMADIESGKQLKLTEGEILTHPRVFDFYKKARLTENGLTLEQLGAVASLLGFGSNKYYALKNGNKSLIPASVELGGNFHVFSNIDEFRRFVAGYLQRPITGLVVNYDMLEIGYPGLRGHFSPLAAYHKDSDRMLVMDVWPDTVPVWVKTEDLYRAMCAVDSISQAPRGLLHIHELLI